MRNPLNWSSDNHGLEMPVAAIKDQQSLDPDRSNAVLNMIATDLILLRGRRPLPPLDRRQRKRRDCLGAQVGPGVRD